MDFCLLYKHSFQALKDKQAAQTSSIVYAHLGYARILMQQNKQLEAILLLKQGIAISYAPVSYTHLDVYKRQHPYPRFPTTFK